MKENILLNRNNLSRPIIHKNVCCSLGGDLDISHGCSHFHYSMEVLAVDPDDSSPDIDFGRFLLDSQDLHFGQFSHPEHGTVGKDQFSFRAFVSVESVFCPNGGV